MRGMGSFFSVKVYEKKKKKKKINIILMERSLFRFESFVNEQLSHYALHRFPPPIWFIFVLLVESSGRRLLHHEDLHKTRVIEF
jgi:hypothetical protein